MTGRFYFDPDATGAAMFMGKTEARLMELAWEKNELTVKTALFFLGSKQPLAYTTVLTTLSRLTRKGYLNQIKRGRSFLFKPAESRDKFIDRRFQTVYNSLKKSFPRRLARLK